MEEPEPVVARAGGRDSNVTADDHVAIYMATTGSAFLEIAVNTVGAIADSRGAGPLRLRPQSSWNASIETQTDIRHGHWIARVNISLSECAAALGEAGIPRDWRILVARLRAARPGEAAEQSSLPVIGGSSSFYGPIRYRRAVLSDSDPTRVARIAPAYEQTPKSGLAGELASLNPNVWSASQRRQRGVRGMVSRYLENRIEQAVLAERRAWEEVRTRADWEKFRDVRIQALRESVGVFPPERQALDSRVTAKHQGDGYRLENVIFQTRPGSWMAANLYLPSNVSGRIPGMIIVHSQHYPKTQGELHDMGELWARTGAAVLVMERPGYGERVETTPWYRQSYASRHTFTKQLFVAGESYSGWAAWDIIRSVDYLTDRPEIDSKKIIVLGSVAGGGEPAGVAAALDPRIAAVVPFNYDQGHVRVHGDSPGQIAKQFSPWVVAASVAPRRFVRAFEFGWEGAEEADYPSLWFDGLERSEKVWEFYNARENLATSQAYGLIRLSMERVSHCFSIGPQQRAELYPIFERWFGIPLPSAKDLAILPDSLLGVNATRDEARRQEAQRRRPHSDLLSIPPAVSAQIERRKMHQIAYDIGQRALLAARKELQSLRPAQKVDWLREKLRPMLGDIEPVASPHIQLHSRPTLSGAKAEALSLTVEDGIDIPLLLLLPEANKQAPVVVAVAQGGKARFLANRAGDLETLLKKGIAVCLADVRATGETSPSQATGENLALAGLAQREFDLARSLLGSRLKDLRTVFAYLRTRSELDRRRMAVWGDSFAPPNASPLFLDEIEVESGPQIQYRADPTGGHLALLAGLYEPEIHAIAARGALAGYLTVLDDAFTYVPLDAIVLGILKAGDIADIAAAVAPRPLALEALVDGRNIRLDTAAMNNALSETRRAYGGGESSKRLRISEQPGDMGQWLTAAIGN
jgi:dienelactone hydrolase